MILVYDLSSSRILVTFSNLSCSSLIASLFKWGFS